jgi:hypothetical protein
MYSDAIYYLTDTWLYHYLFLLFANDSTVYISDIGVVYEFTVHFRVYSNVQYYLFIYCHDRSDFFGWPKPHGCLFLTFFLGSIQTCNIIYLFIVMIGVIFLVGQNPMDANNWRPTAPSGEPVIDTGDWRIQLQPDSRKRIVDKM